MTPEPFKAVGHSATHEVGTVLIVVGIHGELITGLVKENIHAIDIGWSIGFQDNPDNGTLLPVIIDADSHDPLVVVGSWFLSFQGIF